MAQKSEKQFDHGPRLTDEEYDKKIVELHTGLPPVPSREQTMETRRQELNLAIYHRLGRDFPKERCAALWEVRQRVERKRIRLMLKYLWRRLFGKSLALDAPSIARYVVDEHATVLSDAELESFFGVKETHHPDLPIDG